MYTYIVILFISRSTKPDQLWWHSNTHIMSCGGSIRWYYCYVVGMACWWCIREHCCSLSVDFTVLRYWYVVWHDVDACGNIILPRRKSSIHVNILSWGELQEQCVGFCSYMYAWQENLNPNSLWAQRKSITWSLKWGKGCFVNTMKVIRWYLVANSLKSQISNWSNKHSCCYT